MTFEQAITALKRGERIARSSWDKTHVYLDDGFALPVICRFAHGSAVPEWSPTSSDMLATDWVGI